MFLRLVRFQFYKIYFLFYFIFCLFCWLAPFLIRRVIYEIFSRDTQVAGKRLQRPSHTKHNSSRYFFGIFWYTIFTHFLAAGKNNARTLPQVVIERERERKSGGGRRCSSASVSLPLLLLYSFPPSLSISLDGRRVHSSGRRRVHHQHRRGIFFSRSFVFAASATAPAPPAPSPAPTLSALASQSSNQPHLKYLWLLFD